MGWLVKGKGTAADVFVPFAFEVGGALGSEAEAFLRECTAVAEWKNQGVGDLAHWSSMTWGGHWRQRIGVELPLNEVVGLVEGLRAPVADRDSAGGLLEAPAAPAAMEISAMLGLSELVSVAPGKPLANG